MMTEIAPILLHGRLFPTAIPIGTDEMLCTVNGETRSVAWLFANADTATSVTLYNLPRLTNLPNLDAATNVYLDKLPGITSLPNLDAATEVLLKNLPGITSLPYLNAATYVWLNNLPGLTSAYAGEDSRKYKFFVIRMRNEWRIIAGCRNFSFDEARKHWGPEGESDRPDCLALVEKLIASVQVAA